MIQPITIPVRSPHTSPRMLRGRRTYGPRKVITVRIAECDMARVEAAAAASGHESSARWATEVIYQALGLQSPPWTSKS